MANAKYSYLKLLFFTFFCAAFLVSDATSSRLLQVTLDSQPTVDNLLSAKGEVNFKDKGRRLLIGSVAPTCTYNECRGCKYKCRAEQVPVEGNDPINSAYHYKCVCHR